MSDLFAKFDLQTYVNRSQVLLRYFENLYSPNNGRSTHGVLLEWWFNTFDTCSCENFVENRTRSACWWDVVLNPAVLFEPSTRC